jgi:NhaP-type Na+/H+ or K+/H+ antiporter
MHLWSLTLVIVFGMIFLLGLISSAVTDWMPISEPLMALAVGAVLGLVVLEPTDILHNLISREVLHELAAVTLAIALMTTALQLPHQYMRRRWKTVLILLGLGMPIMWLLSGAALYLVLSLPAWVALLIGGIITPTDPVLASTIVTGQLAEKNIAGRIRHLIIVESGLNDGLAYAFVLLPVNLLIHAVSQGIRGWFVWSVLWEVGGAMLFGIVIGLAAGWLANWALAAHFTAHASFLGMTLALALVTLGALELIGTDAILGVFTAGLAFSETLNYRGHQLERAEHVQETVERFFILPVFFVLGGILPWGEWQRLGWSAVFIVLAILVFRRLPMVLALSPWLHPAISGRREALFMGWFGPIGISALFYATLDLPSRAGGVSLAAVWPVTSLIIFASVVAHGASATGLTRLFGRSVAKEAERSRSTRSETQQQEDVVEEIGNTVRTKVQEATATSIQDAISRGLTRKQGDYHEDAVTPLTRYWRSRMSRGQIQPEIGSEVEESEKVAHEIAREIAHRLADDAAQSVSDQLTRYLEEEGAEEDEESGERNGGS